MTIVMIASVMMTKMIMQMMTLKKRNLMKSEKHRFSTVKFDDFNTITDMSLYEDENFESFVMDEEEEDDMVDDLDDLLSERPKERRSHSEKDDTFQVDYIDLD